MWSVNETTRKHPPCAPGWLYWSTDAGVAMDGAEVGGEGGRHGGLLTDLYELNMAAVYLRRGMTGPATFSLFVRQLPSNRGFLVAAGLADCLDFLERFRFVPDELDWLSA